MLEGNKTDSFGNDFLGNYSDIARISNSPFEEIVFTFYFHFSYNAMLCIFLYQRQQILFTPKLVDFAKNSSSSF